MELLRLMIKASQEAAKEIMEIYATDFEVEYKEDNSPLTLADRRANDVIQEHLSEMPHIPCLSEESAISDYSERKNWSEFFIIDPIDGTKEFVKKNGEFTVNIGYMKDNQPIAGVVYAPAQNRLFFGEEGQTSRYDENFTLLSEIPEDLFTIGNAMPTVTQKEKYTVMASRSHIGDRTRAFMKKMEDQHGEIDIIRSGSSLKICLIGAGIGDIYPRFGPTSEWDTGAAHAVIRPCGIEIFSMESQKPLEYNKESIRNPEFFVCKEYPT